jgi:hypothetical protein
LKRGNPLSIGLAATQGFFYCPKIETGGKNCMTETKPDEILNGAEYTPDENLSAPAEQQEQTANDTLTDYLNKSDAPPLETPAPDMSDTLPAPDSPEKTDGDGEVVIPSNVINGVFGDKQAAENEAEKQAAEQDNPEKDAPAQKRGGRPPKADKSEKETESKKPDKEKAEKPKRGDKPTKTAKESGKAVSAGGGGIGGAAGQTPEKEEAPHAPATPENVAPTPEPPKDATRPGEKETIVYIDHSELHPFKNHPFQVRDDDAMKTLVASVKERGVDQPAIVRPRESGGYEIVAGHRRQLASEQAGLKNIPCVIRNMTDDEAILAMTESNFNQRSEILPSERAQALKMQLDAIKRQGARFNGVATGDIGKRSNEIVAERNQMAVKQVQRYIALNNLTPDLMKFVDDKKVPFTAAVEMSYIKPKNQNYIAVAIDSQQSSPSLAQAQRMRELDQKNVLNGDVIDGIMLEEKKEETRVILNSQELGKYFGPDKTPREMKDTILKLLDEYKEKQPLDLGKPEKKAEMEK